MYSRPETVQFGILDNSVFTENAGRLVGGDKFLVNGGNSLQR